MNGRVLPQSLLETVAEALGYETPQSRLHSMEDAAKRTADVCDGAATKLHRGQPVSRAEAAAFLGVSTKKLQRMEAVGSLNRCPGLGLAVRYAARDVLRLASANGKER